MHVGPARDERQRDATPVDQQTSFAPFFSPDPWGWAPRTRWPRELSPSPRPRFASPRQYLPSRRTRPTRLATRPRRNPPGAIAENADGSHWHFHIPSARLSTDNPCAGHTRSRQTPCAAASVSARLPVGVDTCALPNVGERVSAALLSPKTRRKLPKILSVASWAMILPQSLAEFNSYLRISSKEFLRFSTTRFISRSFTECRLPDYADI
jgi:hypothetical protein